MDTKTTPEPQVPAIVNPPVVQETPDVLEGVPVPYKVPDYEDAIPVGKSLAIVGGIVGLVICIFFLAKSPKTVDLQQSGKNDVDFNKMNGQAQQRMPQGQVAGAMYGPPAGGSPSPTTKADKTPTPTEAETPTPTPTNSPTPTPTNKPDEPTSTPTPVPNTPTPTPEPPTSTPTTTVAPTPS